VITNSDPTGGLAGVMTARFCSANFDALNMAGCHLLLWQRSLCHHASMRSVYLAVWLWLLGIGAVAQAAAASGEVLIGQPLREARLHGLNGPDSRLSSYRGRPLLINVWASWCGPCRTETRSLERLAWSEAGRAFGIIGISTDDYVALAVDWLKQSHGTISHFIDRDLEMEHMLGASRLPLTILVDAKGRVIARIYGAREWDSPESIALLERTFGLRGVAK
jgi:thiol-disulfide isomerase/thioredoxin